VSLRVVRRRSKVSHAAASKAAFGRLLNVGDCLPVGTQVLEQQYCGIVNDDGVVGDKRQRKVLTGGRFVSTEDELGACANTLLEMPRDVFKSEFREIFEAVEKDDRTKTKEASEMLKQCIQEHVIRVHGTRAQTRVDRVARNPGAIASTSQPQTIVPRRNTNEVIEDETVDGEMMAEFLCSRGRLREEDVQDFLLCHCLRTDTFLNAVIKQANATYESNPAWHMTAEERRNMLRRERRVGVSETQMDAVVRAAAPSVDEDTEMEDLNDDQRISGSQSGNARTNKNVSGRQRSVLQDIINEVHVGGTSD
jgi:hypothetical protein